MRSVWREPKDSLERFLLLTQQSHELTLKPTRPTAAVKRYDRFARCRARSRRSCPRLPALNC